MGPTEPPSVDITRVLLLHIPKMLSDILRGLVTDELDLELVAEVENGHASLRQLEDAGAHVVIVGLDDDVVPDVCTDLLARRPTTRVIGLTPRGNRAIVYELRPHRITVGEVSPHDLVGLIREGGAGTWRRIRLVPTRGSEDTNGSDLREIDGRKSSAT